MSICTLIYTSIFPGWGIPVNVWQHAKYIVFVNCEISWEKNKHFFSLIILLSILLWEENHLSIPQKYFFIALLEEFCRGKEPKPLVLSPPEYRRIWTVIWSHARGRLRNAQGTENATKQKPLLFCLFSSLNLFCIFCVLHCLGRCLKVGNICGFFLTVIFVY